MTTRETIIRTLGSYSAAFDESVVDMLDKRVQSATLKDVPDKKSFNPTALAFTIAKNWAIDEQRRIAAGARKQAEALLAADRERKEKELYERCLKEFDKIFFRLLPELKCSQPKQLHIVRLICFDLLSGEELGKALPGTSREQRFKWKARGYKLVLPCASTELTAYLRRFLIERSDSKH